MFSKNNVKHIFILAIGFFWCSSLYLTQEQYLANYANVNFVNIAELLFGSLSMALGILTFGFLYKKNKNIKKKLFSIYDIDACFYVFIFYNL